jgi:acyl-CoA thioester hydrolase
MNDFPVRVRFPLHWGDMDAFGHVNNTRYFAWFESARIAYLQEVGLPVERSPQGVGPILVRVHADFVEPLVYPAQLVASARVTAIGATSITFEHAVDDAETGERYAHGAGVVVVLAYRSHEKMAVPAEVRSAIERLEGRTF